MKRLLTILLALVMVLALGTSAFAAQDGTVTVYNATVDHKYAGYKIFDATWDDVNESIAYTIHADSFWYPFASPGSAFTLTSIGGDLYNVIRNVGVTDADVIAEVRGWLVEVLGSSYEGTLPMPELEEVTATTTEVVWENVEYGYYLVTSTLGALVTVSNVNGNVIIIDKNQTPGWENPDPEGDTQAGKNVSADGDTYGKTSTAGINDEVHYKINAFVPKYHGDKQVYKYTFTDTLGDGLTYNDDITLAFLEKNTNGEDEEVAIPSGVIVSTDVAGQAITVTLRVAGNYPTDARLQIKYSATVNGEAEHVNQNKADMTWTEYDPAEDPGVNPGDPNYPEEPGEKPNTSTTNTYVYGFYLQKYAVDAEQGNELNGATFVLYDAETGGTLIPVVWVSEGVYRVATDEDTEDDYVEIQAGYATIFGLDLGDYWLEEVEAPDGYNKLESRHKVTIAKSYIEDGGEEEVSLVDEYGYLLAEVQVINKTGTLLPETGGIGTKIFYILGGILALGALVILVSRRRMPNGR